MIRLGSALAAGCIALSFSVAPDVASARGLGFEDFFNHPSGSRANDRGGFWSLFSRPSRSEPVVEPEPPYVAPVYEPDPLNPLKDAAIDAERPKSELAGALYDTLKNGADPVIRVHPDHKQPLIDFYQARGFAPLWVSADGVNLRAERMLQLLSKADLEGLRAGDYLPEALGSFNPEQRPVLTGAADLARLDIELSVAAVKYAHHATAGRIIPDRLSKYVDIHPVAIAPDVVLKALARTVRPDAYLAGLHPTHPVYAAFKKELLRLREAAKRDAEISIPEGGLLKLNASDSRVLVLRKKLESLGLLEQKITWVANEFRAKSEAELIDPVIDPSKSRVYDGDVVDAVKRFQKLRGLAADGVVGPATTRVMNGDSSEKRIEKLVLNIERLRWLPDDLGKTYVQVNQAAFEMKLFDDGELIHKARVIVGKTNHQTPAFSDQMEFVVINPYWNVPSSIATKEMLPYLISDPSYLDSRGFEVMGRTGQVSSSSVDWEEYEGQDLPYTFRQPPGPGNALGVVKFLFPNHHNVYMHDTPTKHLFAQSTRAFSHGCVRVQNADKLADVILGREGWTPADIRTAIATGENQKITLKNKISVYLTYFTAWANGGDLTYYDDIYGRDELLKRALGENRVAMK